MLEGPHRQPQSKLVPVLAAILVIVIIAFTMFTVHYGRVCYEQGVTDVHTGYYKGYYERYETRK